MKRNKNISLITTFLITGLLSCNLYAADGGETYKTYCAVCHKSGLNAAPKTGKKAFWIKRVAQGKETVYKNAIEGLRGMPPRGGIASLSDDDVKAAVDYMVGRSGGWGK
jgi:cytochrome c5